MADESRMLGLATIGVIIGAGVLLYGVKQTNGETLNAVMVAGGAVILIATGLLSAAVSRLDWAGEH